MLRMDQVHVIRHKVLIEDRSRRSVAREMGVSRNTVRKYLRISEPRRVETGPRARPVLERVAPRLEELMEEWFLRTTRKQRITGTRLHRQLVEEDLAREMEAMLEEAYREGAAEAETLNLEWESIDAEVEG